MGCRDDGPTGPPEQNPSAYRESQEQALLDYAAGRGIVLRPEPEPAVSPSADQRYVAQALTRAGERRAAAGRVARFLDAWESAPTRTDLVYGLGVHKEDETRDLLATDLRLLLEALDD